MNTLVLELVLCHKFKNFLLEEVKSCHLRLSEFPEAL
jgi:hypothetical protein